ncbi:Hydroxyacid oxidase 1 [Araneus ventricosus]|uniref:(S)-2-hydroxy-acid oxidase n=1 Tax=Araneus ventricosus TaxID=182803 RepID=A0A4Y2B0Y3_ARAVE|nr:Hydroxyacid oxidase 1 [Araneus ventricosus]
MGLKRDEGNINSEFKMRSFIRMPLSSAFLSRKLDDFGAISTNRNETLTHKSLRHHRPSLILEIYEALSSRSNLLTVDEYDRCGPAKLPLTARNYFLGASGRRTTYKRNKDAFDEIKIVPRMLRDVSKNSLETSTLGLDVDFPIGLSPVALHRLAHPDGEIATVAGISPFRTIMILSSFASTLLEEVARAAQDSSIHLWMQMYIFDNHTWTTTLIRRAERSGFRGIVITADSPVYASLTCDGRNQILTQTEVDLENIDASKIKFSPSAVFRDITWLRSLTKLPIIIKGLLSGADATRAILAGASAILVSNHGGRQMDGAPAAIEALPGVVDAVNKLFPRRDVYMDGGVRSGQDVFKAIARGAKMVFIGRPIIWGLAIGGAKGVNNVMTTLRNEFNETMLLAGASNVKEIRKDTLIPLVPIWG